MGLFSILGRFLFGSFFIISAWQTLKEVDADITLFGKKYAARMASFLDLFVFFSETEKMKIVYNFLSTVVCFKIFGGFLLIFGRLEGVFFLASYLLASLPILCDFYHYKVGEPEFTVLLQDFVQNISLLGAVMMFTEMKIKLLMRQPKKVAPKSKRV